MCWSKSIFTSCRDVFMPTLMSRRITGSASGFNSFSRSDSAVSVTSRPTEAVPRKISVPSLRVMPMAQMFWPGFGISIARLHLLALEYGVAVVRRQAAGLEPCLAPDALASGANWLKWVGPSMVPPWKPSFCAVASSWIEACES